MAAEKENPMSLAEALQLFQDLPGYRNAAQPPVTQMELRAYTGLLIHHLEEGTLRYTPKTLIEYASRIIGLSSPIEGMSDEVRERLTDYKKQNSLRQALWRERHPETERERQQQKKRKRKALVENIAGETESNSLYPDHE